MDLSFGAEYDEFRTEIKQFIASRGDKSPKQTGMGNTEAIAWQKILIDNGYAARTIPAKYGGFGAEPDIIKSRIISEEFSGAQVSTGLGGQGISMLTPVLLELGTEEQKQQFIKPTIHWRNDLVPRLLGTRCGQ